MSMDDFNVNDKINLLIHADNKTFVNLCQSNKEFNTICNEKPYSERIFKDRSEMYLPEYLQYKPEAMKWKEFYIRISNLVNAIDNNMLPQLQANGDQNMLDYIEDVDERDPEFLKLINRYAFNGDLFETEVLLKMYHELPAAMIFELVAEKGDLEMVKWFVEHNVYTNDAFPAAAQNGHIDILEYLISFDPNQDYERAVTFSAERENLKALKFLAAKGFVPTNGDLNNAVIDANMPILQWAIENSYLTTVAKETIEFALKNGDLNKVNSMFTLLFSNGVQIVNN